MKIAIQTVSCIFFKEVRPKKPKHFFVIFGLVMSKVTCIVQRAPIIYTENVDNHETFRQQVK